MCHFKANKVEFYCNAQIDISLLHCNYYILVVLLQVECCRRPFPKPNTIWLFYSWLDSREALLIEGFCVSLTPQHTIVLAVCLYSSVTWSIDRLCSWTSERTYLALAFPPTKVGVTNHWHMHARMT